MSTDGLRQRRQPARLVAVELHEHEVPDLDVAVAVGLGRAGRPAGDLGAVVVEDLASTGPHGPVSPICQKLSLWNGGPPGLSPMRTMRSAGTPISFVQMSVGLVVVVVDRDPQPVRPSL